MGIPRRPPPHSSWPPVFLFVLLLAPLQARPLLVHSSINVAVVFSGSSYQSEVRGRLSGENFVDLPVVVSPVTVLVNDTNPRDLLTHLCDTMATEKLHGVVFEDDVGSGADAQEETRKERKRDFEGKNGWGRGLHLKLNCSSHSWFEFVAD
ncbi:hypothetical protein AMECASPLE_013790 [Ameca splendens]|uniref:Uncharacterized protein n=1 Tax=Ameca splendens TaxID=208324 RepID=A0ABV1AAY6_9TELE